MRGPEEFQIASDRNHIVDADIWRRSSVRLGVVLLSSTQSVRFGSSHMACAGQKEVESIFQM